MAKNEWRILNRDGSLNISKAGYSSGIWSDPYHVLLTMSWPRFFLFIFITYICVNILFGLAYYSAGPNVLEGIQQGSEWQRYVDCFFFSVQTIATIGYGRISPVGISANILMAVEAFLGMLSLALGTGILFARFSRPTAKVIFSKIALRTKHDGQDVFLFRAANARPNNQIMEAHMSVVLIKTIKTKEGEDFRNLYDLKLERHTSPIFTLSWTAVHVIDQTSPLYGMDMDDLIREEAEIVVSITGLDTTFSQTVHARFSYAACDILWDHRFDDIIKRLPDGKIHISLEKIHTVRPML